MSDADKAYRIAWERIEKAKAAAPPARVLSLSLQYAENGRVSHDHTPELRALDRLPPEIADLTDLRTLTLGNTQVANISPLTNMKAMQRLYLHGTQVTDISPLADMTDMQTLYLDGTKADLRQLVAEGAAWAEEDHALRDLEFRETLATQPGECLHGLYVAHENSAGCTKAALAALRADRNRRAAEGACIG